MLKTQASLTDEPPRKIVSKFVEQVLNSETIVKMPSYSADRQAINRAKAKTRPLYPLKPMALSDIELPEFLKHAISRKKAEDGTEMEGETFLLHDSGVDDPDRFFMFGTEANVRQLEMSELYADGTFSISPDLFLQVGIAYKRKPAYVILDEQLIFAAKSYSKESFATYYDTINSIVS